MIASIESTLDQVRASGLELAEAIPASRSFVKAVNIALDVLADSVTPPSSDRPPFTRREAAEYLAISTTTFDVLRRKGEIVACGENGFPSGVGFRRQLRFAKAELDRVLGAK